MFGLLLDTGTANGFALLAFQDVLARWSSTWLAVGWLLLPILVSALTIHFFEKLIQSRMANRFGWSSVLATGWIGTPIHELSHVIACWIFGHRIDAIAFFEPDKQSGRLGYVKHSCNRKNWYQEIGNVFIAIAPFIGGSLVLMLLIWMFYPDALNMAFESARELKSQSGPSDYFWSIRDIGVNIAGHFDLLTFRFWLFVYLVLCVASHMAPSASDYAGAGRGALILSGMLVAISIPVAAFESVSESLIAGLDYTLVPLTGLLGIATVLTILVAIGVWLITALYDLVWR